MKSILLILLAFSLPVWAKELATHESLAAVLEEIRDPVFTSADRKSILSFSRLMMARKLAAQMGVSEAELNLAFVKNPTKAELLLRDPWYDVQTQFYTTLHLENYHSRWMALQKLHKFSNYGLSLHNTMMAHWGRYSPVTEGRFYNRWAKIGIKTGTTTRNFNIPYFLMSPSTPELIAMEAHTPYTEIFESKTAQANFLKNTSSLTRLQKQELAEKLEFNRRIYIRAVANSAKTIASIRYLTGESNRHQTESKIASFLEGFCDGCSVSEKKEYKKAAMTYVDNMKNAMSVTTVPDLTKTFCKSLKQNSYHWNVDKLKPTPIEVALDNTKLINYYLVHKLKTKNREALAKTIVSNDMGILFLTGAINVLDKMNEPIGTKLGCVPATDARDVSFVRASIEEAETNVETYVVRLNRKLKESRYDLTNVTNTLEYFIQTNQTASIEAAATFPQGIGYVLKSIVELDRDAKRRKTTDTVVAWGGTILGVGLTLTGIGAPEGVAVLVATAGIVKGLSAGSYFLVRSQQEKQFARELRLAKNGAAGLSDANLKIHYKAYKSLKVSYIKEFAGTAISFMTLHRLALRQTGDVAKANTVLKRVIETAKATGKEEAMGQLQEMVIRVAIGT